MKIFVYQLLLDNDEFYVGMTNNPERRKKDHEKGSGSIWTKGKKILEMKILWEGPVANKYQAMLIENTWAERKRAELFEKKVWGGYLSKRYKKIIIKRALRRSEGYNG